VSEAIYALTAELGGAVGRAKKDQGIAFGGENSAWVTTGKIRGLSGT